MLITLRHNSTISNSAVMLPDAKELANCSSYILKTKVKSYHIEAYHSHLSIKSATSGTALYEINNGRYMPDKETYLVLNPEQKYSLTVDSQTGAEGLIIFFAVGFAEEVYRSLTTPIALLLQEPQKDQLPSLEFIQRLYPHDDIVSPSLKTLWESLNACPAQEAWYEEQLHRIMRQLLYAHRKVWQEIETLPAIRATTRAEIYKRIYRARDYIAASIDSPLTLSEMAQVACLSPNHFMRTFKQIFRVTPYQYLTILRLERAKQLLHTKLSITEICFLAGFESPGHFSRFFHHRVGMSPQAYRQQER